MFRAQVMLAYRVDLTPDDNGTLLVTCPDLPGVVTFAETEADVPALATDAIETMLESMLANGEAVPAPSELGRDGLSIRLKTSIALKLALHDKMRRGGVSRDELASRMGLLRAEIDELFLMDDRASLDRLEAAFGRSATRSSFSLAARRR